MEGKQKPLMPSPYELPTRWLEWHKIPLDTDGIENATRWFEICEELDPRLVALVFEMELPQHQRALRSLVTKLPIEILREVLAEREKSIPQAPAPG